MGDVWSAGRAGHEPLEGKSINEAFSVDVVARLGLALFREQPILVLGSGASLFTVYVLLPVVVNVPLSLVFESALADLDPLRRAVADQVLGLGTAALFFPVQQTAMAGAIVAAARYVQHDELVLSALFTSFHEGVRAILFGLLSGAIGYGLAAVWVGLGAAAFFALMPVHNLAAAGAVSVVAVLGVPVLVYITLPLMLGTYAAVLEDLGPLAALKRVWSDCHGARVTLFVLAVITSFAAILGCAVFCVGMVPVLGVLQTALATSWLLHARSREETGAWAFFARNL